MPPHSKKFRREVAEVMEKFGFKILPEKTGTNHLIWINPETGQRARTVSCEGSWRTLKNIERDMRRLQREGAAR